MGSGGGLNLWGIPLLWLGVGLIGVISSHYRARMPEWGVALAAFLGIASLVLGLGMLVLRG
jgi:hypothetical protein